MGGAIELMQSQQSQRLSIIRDLYRLLLDRLDSMLIVFINVDSFIDVCLCGRRGVA